MRRRGRSGRSRVADALLRAIPSAFAWLAALLFLTGCAQDSGCSLGLVATLPFAIRDDHLFTAAALNGRPARLLIDTGWGMTSILAARAAYFGLHPVPTQATIAGIGGERRLYALRARSFRLGNLHGEDLPLTMVDMPLLGDTAPDGILGADYLASYDLDFDFASRSLRLFQPLSSCRSPHAPLPPPLYLAPLAASPNAFDFSPYLQVRIAGETVYAELDTGAPHSVLFRGAARRLGLTAPSLRTELQVQASGVGPQSVTLTRHVMAPITIGEITITHLPVEIADTTMGDGTEMLLGLDFMSRVHVFLSARSKTLIMQYPPRPSPPVPDEPAPAKRAGPA